ncbi:WD40 repeat-like protein [Artomyces pyxidatus]|uniref:WD40 repeat-like protein n=1 Tax=Artomyces pyxidatus TaxID=48021 RepID=A0ACB8TKZ6_9AGAM|nr:WD40 repeat-like protein [Artomyces pyxidatus]
MSLSESPALTENNTPLRSVKLPSEAYILSLAALPSSYAVSASAPSNSIHLYDKGSFRHALTLRGHDGGTTSLRAVDSVAGTTQRALVSSGKDGTVSVWDDRTGGVGVKMLQAGQSRALLCCDISPDGLTVAAGSELKGDDAVIAYWDPRNPAAPLRTHASTHSDDVTALHFLRSSSPVAGYTSLLSASSDGLLSISNAEEDDEDEAVVHMSNWGCSISQVGWVPQSGALTRVWAASDMETFSVWSEELDLANDLDIRTPSVHTQGRTWVTDYLIGSHASSESGLSLFVGSNEGDVALIRNAHYDERASSWTLDRLWTGGHSGVVRGILCDERNNILLTGGEDSKLHAWSFPPLGDVDMDLDIGSPLGQKRGYDSDVKMEEIPKKIRRD